MRLHEAEERRVSTSVAQSEGDDLPARSPRLIVHVDESAVGVGKTERAITRALRLPARWLFAVERLDSIDEVASRMATRAGAGVGPNIVKIRSDPTRRGFSVRQEVEALPERYENGHVIALCTHEALLMSDLADFVGWHLVIDEVPNVLLTQEVESKLDLSFFATHYALTRVTDEWSKVALTEAGRGVTGSDLYQDDSHRHLRLFHQRVARSTDTSRAVLCNLHCWEEMQHSNTKWVWWSLFSVRELASFASILCLGNGFMAAVATKMMQAWDQDVEWRPTAASGTRHVVPRRVSVRYFSSDRRAAKSFFESGKGRHALVAIGTYIAAQVPHDRFIWSANDVAVASLSEALPSVGYLKPKQAGSSKWMHCTHAAMIYAAKPNPNIRSVLDAIGVSHADWMQTVEFETVLQFVTRTSIRDVSNAAHATVYVFDRWQADYLMAFFGSQDHIDADVEHVYLGLDFEQGKPGRKARVMSPEEAEQREADRRVKRATYERRRRERLAANKATSPRGTP